MAHFENIGGSLSSDDGFNWRDIARLLDWQPADADRIRRVPWSAIAEHVAPRFYARLAAIPRLDEIIRAYSSYEALDRMLREYFVHLGDNPTQPAVIGAVQEIGAHHTSLGLSTEWFLSAYWLLLLETTTEALSQMSEPGNAHLVVESVIKRLAFDMLIMVTQQATYYTFHDFLTRLPNRLALQHYAETLIRLKSEFSLLIADINSFKALNDGFGHIVGDRILKVVSARWQTALRPGDILSRWGGDEFIFLLPHTPPQDVAPLLQRYLAVLEQPVQLEDGKTVRLSASFGFAVHPRDGQSLTPLVQHADRQLYHAKAASQTWLSPTEPTPVDPDRSVFQAVDAVTRALAEQRIVVQYQPIVDNATWAVLKWEALVRLRDTQGRLHLPASFLPALSRHPLLHRLDQQVIRQVFADLAHWHGLGHHPAIAVNLAWTDLLHEGFFESLADLHQQFPTVSPQAVTFEVLESSAIVEIQSALDMLNRLADRGYGIALDDFGTGFSSLSDVFRVPATVLKIDRAFIQAWQTARGQAVIQAVIGLGRPIGCRIVAEGVEDWTQHETLTRWGCDASQGWLFSPARDAKDVPVWTPPGPPSPGPSPLHPR